MIEEKIGSSISRRSRHHDATIISTQTHQSIKVDDAINKQVTGWLELFGLIALDQLTFSSNRQLPQ
jgi:hypothetical protein